MLVKWKMNRSSSYYDKLQWRKACERRARKFKKWKITKWKLCGYFNSWSFVFVQFKWRVRDTVLKFRKNLGSWGACDKKINHRMLQSTPSLVSVLPEDSLTKRKEHKTWSQFNKSKLENNHFINVWQIPAFQKVFPFPVWNVSRNLFSSRTFFIQKKFPWTIPTCSFLICCCYAHG